MGHTQSHELSPGAGAAAGAGAEPLLAQPAQPQRALPGGGSSAHRQSPARLPWFVPVPGWSRIGPASQSASGSPSVLTPKREEKVKISLQGSFTKEAKVRKNSLETPVSTVDTWAHAPVGGPRLGAVRHVAVFHHQPVWLYNSWLCALE